MRATSLAFPFKPTFRRLELEKRWWHRLCVVIFFAVLLGTAVFTAWVAYSVFVPRVQAMPDIHVCDIFDQVAAEQQHQTVPNGGCLDISAGLVPKQQPTVDYDALAKKFGGVPVQPMIDQQGAVHQIPIDSVMEALKAGDKRVIEMYDPQGTKRWVPEDEVQAAIKAGGKVAVPELLGSSVGPPSHNTHYNREGR